MKNILLVIDVQRALELANDPSLESSILRMNEIIKQYPPEDVYYIQHFEEGSEFDPKSKTAQLHPLLIQNHPQIIQKYHHSAFYQTPLDTFLKQKNIDTIDICGYQIEYCVDATIKTGHFLGYQVRILKDHIHTFDQTHLTKDQIKEHYLQQFRAYGDII